MRMCDGRETNQDKNNKFLNVFIVSNCIDYDIGNIKIFGRFKSAKSQTPQIFQSFTGPPDTTKTEKKEEPNYVIVLSLTARLCHHITPTNNSLFLFLLFYHRHHHHHHYQRCLQRSTHLRYRSRNGGQWQNNSDQTTERTRSTASTPTLRH